MSDMVHSPPHYFSDNGIECVDAIEASMTEEAFNGYLKGSAMAYLWRYEKKGRANEDLQKAMWYLSKLEARVL